MRNYSLVNLRKKCNNLFKRYTYQRHLYACDACLVRGNRENLSLHQYLTPFTGHILLRYCPTNTFTLCKTCVDNRHKLTDKIDRKVLELHGEDEMRTLHAYNKISKENEELLLKHEKKILYVAVIRDMNKRLSGKLL